MKNLKGVSRVRFYDYTEYVPEKSNNGGCYGFWTEYNRLPDGNWEVSYGTTAEFEFCPVCGSFDNHFEESGYSCGEFEVISEEKLLTLINEFVETDDEFIEFKSESDDEFDESVEFE